MPPPSPREEFLAGSREMAGAFEEGTISRWLEDALTVMERFVTERPILVGSSMGGWIACLAAMACT